MKKNMSRRHFLKMGGLALAAMSVRPYAAAERGGHVQGLFTGEAIQIGKSRHYGLAAVISFLEQGIGPVSYTHLNVLDLITLQI